MCLYTQFQLRRKHRGYTCNYYCTQTLKGLCINFCPITGNYDDEISPESENSPAQQKNVGTGRSKQLTDNIFIYEIGLNDSKLPLTKLL